MSKYVTGNAKINFSFTHVPSFFFFFFVSIMIIEYMIADDSYRMYDLSTV